MNDVTRQLAKAITGSPAQTQLKPPAPLSLTRGTIAGINIVIANNAVTTVKLAGSSQAVPCEVSLGYGAKIGDVVDILVAPPRLIVLGPSSTTGGVGGIPDFEGQGDPNGVQAGGAGLWYENTNDGTLWLSSGSNDTWAELNPGTVTLSFCAGDTVTQVIGFGNVVTINSGLSLALGYDNTITTGESAIAIGENNSVTGQGMAIGASAVANALQAVAIGYAATAANDSQIALGGSSSYVLFGNEYNIYTTSGTDPTSVITPLNEGDVCISSAGVWQAGAAADDTSWTELGTGGGGTFVIPLTFSVAGLILPNMVIPAIIPPYGSGLELIGMNYACGSGSATIEVREGTGNDPSSMSLIQSLSVTTTSSQTLISALTIPSVSSYGIGIFPTASSTCSDLTVSLLIQVTV